jgi:hypothetical protein
MPNICPECGSRNLRRSHTQGVSEKLRRFLGWRAFRCREKSCRWRGLIKTISPTEAIGKEIKKVNQKWGRQIIILIIMVLITIIGVLIVMRFGNFEPTATT